MAPPQNEPASDLEAERAIYRECKDALEALAGAFGRAAQRPDGLSSDEITKLRGLCRRLFIRLASVAFPVPGSVEDRHGR